MDNKKPKLRFKGFTDDWKQHKLNEICSITKGKQLNKLDMIDNGKYYVLNGGITPSGYTNEYNTDKNTISISEGGNSCGYVNLNNCKFWSGGHNYTLQKLKINTYYLFQHLKYKEGYIMSLRVGSGLPNIQKNRLEELEINYPNNKEQESIGYLLNLVDKLITLHQRKYDKLLNIKKSLLEKMFPKNGSNIPEIRFKGFTDAWEQRKLGDCIDDLKSGLSRMLSEEDIGLPVVRANNIEDDKLDLKNEIKYWYKEDPQGADTNNYLIHKNDILINFINSESKMGTAAIVETEPNRSTIYTTNILRMRVNEKCNNYFFLSQTHTKSYIDFIKGISKIAVNQASFTTVDFKNYSIYLPIIDEQNKIGKIFKEIDNLITLHQRKYETLKNIKQSLLEKMFI